jgi:hypothetical protein
MHTQKNWSSIIALIATITNSYNVSAQSGQKLREKVVSCPADVII